MDNRLKLVGLAVVAVLALVLLKKGSKLKPVKEPETAAVDKTPKKKEKPFKAPPGTSKAMALFMQDSAVGLKGSNYNELASGKTTMTVTVLPKAVCYAADYEAIALSVADEGSVLLSLEPMEDSLIGKSPAITRKLTVKNLYKGVQMDLPVDFSKTKLYGLYLCGDPKNEGSCGKKKVAAIEDILKSGKTAKTHKNETFFFQLMVMEEHDALAYSGGVKDLNKLADDLPKHDVSKGTAETALDDAGAKMKRLKSMPVVPKRVGNKVAMNIDMPYMDCGHAH